MTDEKRRRFVNRMFRYAERYGVEDIEPEEMVMAVRLYDDGRGIPPKDIAAHLWGRPL